MNTLNGINDKIGKYRWTICALLFFATTINYLDRQVFSLLKSELEITFNWTDVDYANITSFFQFTYAISLLFAGRFIDWLGTKKGYAWSIIIWSIGAMGHALSRGTAGFMLWRGILGFGESGNFPAAIKTTAEWFPKKDRALATGIFNSGSNIGAILAPLTVPFIAKFWGWQMAFIIIGAIGFLWLIFWFWLYETPRKMLEKARIKQAELDYILSDKEDSIKPIKEKSTPPWYIEWGKLLTYKQTWAFTIGKFLTDGVWWFFLFWLPDFLKTQYEMTVEQMAVPLAVLYSMTMVGSIGGGAFPLFFINKGMNPYAGRMKAMLIIALFPLFVLATQYLGTYSFWWAIVLIGIGASAHQAWSANIFTTVSDMFPKKVVGSVTGIGGMAGGLGGILVSQVAGHVFKYYADLGYKEIGYTLLFIFCAFAYLIAWCIMKILVPKFKPIANL
ncbi:MAG: MFS transporter [Dysgonamonadaceae bacterium]|jgi:ACS family hexuronate transporter-like MFS transporter|nr:MFS transporter [Dysgonamonadaceae bacterium]